MQLKIGLIVLLLALVGQFVDLECALGDCHLEPSAAHACVSAMKLLPAPSPALTAVIPSQVAVPAAQLTPGLAPVSPSLVVPPPEPIGRVRSPRAPPPA